MAAESEFKMRLWWPCSWNTLQKCPLLMSPWKATGRPPFFGCKVEPTMSPRAFWSGASRSRMCQRNLKQHGNQMGIDGSKSCPDLVTIMFRSSSDHVVKLVECFQKVCDGCTWNKPMRNTAIATLFHNLVWQLSTYFDNFQLLSTCF